MHPPVDNPPPEMIIEKITAAPASAITKEFVATAIRRAVEEACVRTNPQLHIRKHYLDVVKCDEFRWSAVVAVPTSIPHFVRLMSYVQTMATTAMDLLMENVLVSNVNTTTFSIEMSKMLSVHVPVPLAERYAGNDHLYVPEIKIITEYSFWI